MNDKHIPNLQKEKKDFVGKTQNKMNKKNFSLLSTVTKLNFLYKPDDNLFFIMMIKMSVWGHICRHSRTISPPPTENREMLQG